MHLSVRREIRKRQLNVGMEFNVLHRSIRPPRPPPAETARDRLLRTGRLETAPAAPRGGSDSEVRLLIILLDYAAFVASSLGPQISRSWLVELCVAPPDGRYVPTPPSYWGTRPSWWRAFGAAIFVLLRAWLCVGRLKAPYLVHAASSDGRAAQAVCGLAYAPKTSERLPIRFLRRLPWLALLLNACDLLRAMLSRLRLRLLTLLACGGPSQVRCSSASALQSSGGCNQRRLTRRPANFLESFAEAFVARLCRDRARPEAADAYSGS